MYLRTSVTCCFKMRILHFLLLFASLLAISHCVSHDELLARYRFNADLGYSYTIYWNFDLDEETIYIAVRARTEGWVGFGISPNGQMPYSDVVIGWVTSNGENQETFFEVSQGIILQCILKLYLAFFAGSVCLGPI